MRFSLLLLALPYLALAQDPASEAGQDPYVPVNVTCPKDIQVRKAGELSAEEKAWREARLENVHNALGDYLKNAAIPNFNISDYTKKLRKEDAPVVGLAISGGGSQSGIGGLGIYQAFDSRYEPAVKAGIGGLTQLLTYFTGLSGGGMYTVADLSAANFTSVENLTKLVNYTVNYQIGPSGNVTEYYTELFENAGAKAELGYPVSTSDIFGQWWATYFPESWRFANYSTIADKDSAFSLHTAPMPLLAYVEVVYGVSPEIGGIKYPGNNNTNGFNLTSYEISPFEFGSWAGGRVQGFWPTKYLGTNVTDGKPYNDQCIEGFDKMTFVVGTTGWAFNFYLIDEWYNIPLFAKRHLAGRQSQDDFNITGGIVVPQSAGDSPYYQLLNETASEFGITLDEALWSTWPNPFNNLADAPEMVDTPDLFLVDGSEAGETIPLRPLMQPARAVDFIIAYDATSDSLPYSWVNGTNLYNSYLSVNQSGGALKFPVIPDVKTLVNTNATAKPTFFGCDAGEPDIPLLLYLPNYPWSGYSNFSFGKASFTDVQLNQTLENAFNIATYGNKQLPNGEGGDWATCVACAVIKKSLERAKVDAPDACGKCWETYCWDGKTDDATPQVAAAGPRLLLNESLGFDEWNKTVWLSEGDGVSAGGQR